MSMYGEAVLFIVVVVVVFFLLLFWLVLLVGNQLQQFAIVTCRPRTQDCLHCGRKRRKKLSHRLLHQLLRAAQQKITRGNGKMMIMFSCSCCVDTPFVTQQHKHKNKKKINPPASVRSYASHGGCFKARIRESFCATQTGR